MTVKIRLGLLLLPAALCGCMTDSPLTASPDFQVVTPLEAPIILLHYDYMVKPGPGGHSHAPSADAIRLVVEAFRVRGIVLHVDPQHAEIPEHKYLSFDGGACGPAVDEVSFQALKAEYFQPRGPRPWHYAIFGHYLSNAAPGWCGAGGIATFRGYDLVVAQSVVWLVDFPGTAPAELIPFLDGGTLMHELGHNLGLQHGGDEEERFKPNYFSVMGTYTFGITSAAEPGLTQSVARRLDFSDWVLPPLDERHLDERVGVQAGTNDIVSYLCVPPGEADPVERHGPGTGPIDWDCDGAIEPDVVADLNMWSTGGNTYRVLTGYDDWAHIREFIRTPAYVTSTLAPGRATP